MWEVPDFFEQIAVRVEGLVFSADDIEHGVLRGNRPGPLATAPPFPVDDPRRRYVIEPPDARIHFALNCGACSCPPVRIYDPPCLDEQLAEATRDFVGGEVSIDDGGLVLPKLFEWFEADFVEAGGVVAFLLGCLPPGPARDALQTRGLTGARYRRWDWRLATGTAARRV